MYTGTPWVECHSPLLNTIADGREISTFVTRNHHMKSAKMVGNQAFHFAFPIDKSLNPFPTAICFIGQHRIQIIWPFSAWMATQWQNGKGSIHTVESGKITYFSTVMSTIKYSCNILRIHNRYGGIIGMWRKVLQ